MDENIALLPINHDSDNESLEPPFEIHGINDPLTQNTPEFAIVVESPSDTNQLQSESSDEEVPDSILFEAQQELEEEVGELPLPQPIEQRIPPATTRRKTKRKREAPIQSTQIESWMDVFYLDEFLTDLYNYFKGKGMFCILLEELTNLLAVAFVVALSVFLTECVDFKLLKDSKKLDDLIVEQCLYNMGWITSLLVLMVSVWWLFHFYSLLTSVSKLLEIKQFYNDVLEISDSDLSTMLWNEVSSRINSTFREEMSQNGRIVAELDPHTIANRIMRKDNYLIALFNKDVLNLSLPGWTNKQWLTRLLEGYVSYAIFNYVFDSHGRIRKRFLLKQHRKNLVNGYLQLTSLEKRFQTIGMLTFLFSPFLFVFMIVRYFLTLSQEYRQNPALLTARSYTPIALWKFREFNELDHLFDYRISRSNDSANKFVSFVSGSFATVLLVITLFEEEFQQGFEITPNKSAFFYVGLFGTIYAATHNLTKLSLVNEPQKWLNEVILDTHYHPNSWRNAAHHQRVRNEFSNLYSLKISILIEELLSVLFAPVILYISLSSSAGAIVDFFRECTTSTTNLGYVCTFAIFDLEKNGNSEFGVDGTTRNFTKFGKMEHSFINFKATYPEWNPGMQGSQYITNLLQRNAKTQRSLAAPNFQSRMVDSAIPADFLMNDGSIIEYGAENGYEVGRELFKLLDTVYKGKG